MRRLRFAAPRARVAAFAAVAIAALGACADRPAPPAAAVAECAPGGAACAVELALPRGAAGAPRIVEGRLAPEQASVTYAFSAAAGERLAWKLTGPATRVVLTYPNGDADGPGLPPIIALPASGRYLFALSSNTMAEDIYGPFRLELRLLPAP